VIVLDAFAIEAFFTGEFAAPLVRDVLVGGEQVIVSAINLAEVADRLIRVHGFTRLDLEHDLLSLGVTISDVDHPTALDAAALRAQHYHRARRSISIADCCAAAVTLDRDAVLATSDPALLAMVEDEGGRWMALPDSHGEVWSPNELR
jgi:predicted nucleic acid-binding protein